MRLTRKVAVLAAALVGAAGAVAVVPPALAAVAPTFTVVAECDEASATYTVRWTVANNSETPATVTGVTVTPGSPISALTGIAVGDVLPPASEGSLTATATVHSYLRSAALLRLNLDGSSTAYGRGVALPVCGEPVMPTVTFTSSCEYLTVSVAMPAGGYTLPLTTSPTNTTHPPLVVTPGAPPQTRSFFWFDPEFSLHISIPDIGIIASGQWELPPSCLSPSLGSFQLFALANYRYLIPAHATTPGPQDAVRADETSPKFEGTKLEFFDAGGGDIAIGHPMNGALLTLVTENAPLQWQWNTYVRDSQRFRIVTNSDGTISLRAKLNGKYVTAEKAGAAPLYANRTAVGPWEKFIRYAVGKGPGPITAMINAQFVTAESAGRKPLIANRGLVGHWEYFYVEDLGNGNVALKSLVNGKYVCAESAGKKPLIANRAAVGPWETFKLIQNADGTQSLQAKINGRYVTAESAGRKPLIANRTAIGPWEKFAIVR